MYPYDRRTESAAHMRRLMPNIVANQMCRLDQMLMKAGGSVIDETRRRAEGSVEMLEPDSSGFTVKNDYDSVPNDCQ